MKFRDTQSVRGAHAFMNLLPAKKVVRYRPDEVIFSQGGACGEVCYIEEGLVKLTTVSNRGRGAVLGILGHSDFLGEECLSGETHHQASAVALVPTSIVVIKRRTMLRPNRARPRHRRSPDRIPAASQSPHRRRFDRLSLQLQREAAGPHFALALAAWPGAETPSLKRLHRKAGAHDGATV